MCRPTPSQCLNAFRPAYSHKSCIIYIICTYYVHKRKAKTLLPYLFLNIAKLFTAAICPARGYKAILVVFTTWRAPALQYSLVAATTMFLVTYHHRQRSHREKLILFLLFVIPCAATQLQLSADLGRSWQPFDSPLQSAPSSALVRLQRYPSTHLHLPSCALQGSLRIQVWRLPQSDQPLGLRWYSDVCHPHLVLPTGIVVEHLTPLRRKPEWLSYTRRGEHLETDNQTEHVKEPSFFSKYGLYILLFIGIALGQGIRKGLAELREEMEREELEQKQKDQKQKDPSKRVKLVVPKRKHSGKTRKRTTATTITS